jgi:hypothetical protein
VTAVANQLIVQITFGLVGFYVLYWVVRLAVRHAIEDSRRADEERR